MLRTAGAAPLDRELPVGLAGEAFAADGSLADPDLAVALQALLDELVATARPSVLAA